MLLSLLLLVFMFPPLALRGDKRLGDLCRLKAAFLVQHCKLFGKALKTSALRFGDAAKRTEGGRAANDQHNHEMNYWVKALSPFRSVTQILVSESNTQKGIAACSTMGNGPNRSFKYAGPLVLCLVPAKSLADTPAWWEGSCISTQVCFCN